MIDEFDIEEENQIYQNRQIQNINDVVSNRVSDGNYTPNERRSSPDAITTGEDNNTSTSTGDASESIDPRSDNDSSYHDSPYTLFANSLNISPSINSPNIHDDGLDGQSQQDNNGLTFGPPDDSNSDNGSAPGYSPDPYNMSPPGTSYTIPDEDPYDEAMRQQRQHEEQIVNEGDKEDSDDPNPNPNTRIPIDDYRNNPNTGSLFLEEGEDQDGGRKHNKTKSKKKRNNKKKKTRKNKNKKRTVKKGKRKKSNKTKSKK